jgi:hypothetical protein
MIAACSDSVQSPRGSQVSIADSSGAPAAQPETTNEPASVVNMLSLASPGGLDQTAPWNAQENGVLNSLQQSFADTSGGLTARAVTETETACSGGGVQTRIVDNQDPPWYSAGDVFTTSYSDCVEGNTLTNGSRSYSVDEMTGQPYVTPSWSTTTTMAKTDFSQTNLINNMTTLLNSTDTVALTAEQVPNSPFAFTYTQTTTSTWDNTRPNNGVDTTSSGNVDVTYTWEDFSANPNPRYTWDFVIDTQSSIFGDNRTESLETLSGPMYQAPDSGVVLMTKTDLNGNTTITRITAQSGGVAQVETDIDADGVFDSTSTQPWNQLMVDPILYQYF